MSTPTESMIDPTYASGKGLSTNHWPKALMSEMKTPTIAEPL